MASTTDDKKQILAWIEADKDHLVKFLSRFVAAKSPNPPGDTRKAVKHITGFLKKNKLPHKLIAPQKTMPNVVGSFKCGSPGKHLVLNGHIDCFPVADDDKRWTHGPWSGAVADGKIWGRGAADMKCGTTASIWTYRYIHRLKKKLKGRLTLTAVSDEETFGPWGARYLMEHHPEVHGDCCLNGEPSSPFSVRFGEKGPLWIEFTVATRGAHGAYTHLSESASKLAMKFGQALEAVTAIEPKLPDNVRQVLERNAATIDKAQGAGAAKIVGRVTLNIGVVHSGLKVNMVPGEAKIEADIRLPPGVEKPQVMTVIDKVLADYPMVTMKEINYNPPSWCDPGGDMLGFVQRNVRELKGFEPEPIVSLGGTDARLWRYRNIPAYVYGPPPSGMGSYDEHVEIETFLHIVRTHALSAYDYLSRA
jgi:succinyl-diaminopimelate desuccinylase